jgi:pilus assembly protein CpaE
MTKVGGRRICVYKLATDAIAELPGFDIACALDTREQLRLAIGTDEISALIVDLDQSDALDAIIEAREIKSEIAVVGVTASSDVEFVLAAQRAGCRQITPKPIDLNDLAVALRGALGMSTWGSGKANTLALIGAVGGAGVTTIACTLTMALAKITNSPAALIDVDFDFGGVARAWDINSRYTIADVSETGAAEPFMIEDAMVELAGGVHVLARPPTIEQGSMIEETTLGRIITTVKRMYPHVVLDLPRKLDSVTGCAIQECDKLLIVLQLTVPAIDNASRFVDSLGRFGIPHDRLEFVVNRYRKGIHSVTIENVEGKFKKNVLGVLPNDFRSVAAALDIGKPVSERSPFARAITDLASKLTGSEVELPKKSWLSGLGRGR